MKGLTDREKLLVELVHLLSYGDKLEFGMTLEEVFETLEKPLRKYQNKTCMQLLSKQFIRELRDHLEDRKR